MCICVWIVKRKERDRGKEKMKICLLKACTCKKACLTHPRDIVNVDKKPKREKVFRKCEFESISFR